MSFVSSVKVLVEIHDISMYMNLTEKCMKRQLCFTSDYSYFYVLK